VTENIRSACIHTHTELIRLVRDEGTWDGGDITCVSSAKEAAEFLSRTEGNVLLTTGSKDLAEFTAVPEFEERIYARVLSLPDVVKRCDEMGFRGNH
ncbi:precorrin-6A/cobalt-precorrin-6A reductase, partial [Anaerostipes caccae]|uniref:precorrin-6A/cobalt-precorrin-6A reductase n=1 Tax=Anaerostipes caccae TaxID=105841 RepID=UPI00210B0B60